MNNQAAPTSRFPALSAMDAVAATMWCDADRFVDGFRVAVRAEASKETAAPTHAPVLASRRRSADPFAPRTRSENGTVTFVDRDTSVAPGAGVREAIVGLVESAVTVKLPIRPESGLPATSARPQAYGDDVPGG